MSGLPKGWEQVPLGKFAAKTKNVDPSKSPGEVFDLYSVPSFSTGSPEEVSDSEIKSAKQAVQPGDVLLCKIVPHINRVWTVKIQGHHRQIASGEWIVYRNHGCEPHYLRYCLSEGSFRERFLSTVAGVGGSLMRARPSEVAKIEVPIAPVPEQHRIVVKLDSLTGRTARAREELGRIPRLIQKYREAILVAAFRGELTRDRRIHFSRHQQSLKPTLVRGEHSSQAQGKWVLPEGWSWVMAGSLCEIKGGITLGKRYPGTTRLVIRPYLRVANVQRGWLNLNEIKTIRVTAHEAEALTLRSGDILMNEGGDRDKLGRGWIWENQIADCIHQNHVFRLRVRTASVPPRYISLYANAFGQQYFIDEGKQTTNLASISMKKVAALPIPVACADEMQEVVRRIETAFAWLDHVAAEHANASRLLPKLDQAILAKAFRGELVLSDGQPRTLAEAES